MQLSAKSWAELLYSVNSNRASPAEKVANATEGRYTKEKKMILQVIEKRRGKMQNKGWIGAVAFGAGAVFLFSICTGIFSI